LLSNIGILPGGTFSVSSGDNATTYKSTGTDTVGDLINALNIDLPTNANVTATLNSRGQLVITSRDDTDAITIGGSGTDAAVLGFAVNNTFFSPVAPSSNSSDAASSSSSATSSSSGTSSSTGSSKSNSTSTSKLLPSNLALAEQGVTTAAGILSAAGVSGTLVDLLA
jgi:hypothetical protein